MSESVTEMPAMPATETHPSDWDAWFEAHGPRLLLFARQQTRCEADAQDVLQEAFVRAWRRREFSHSIAPESVFAEIRRAAIDWYRGSDRRRQREDRALRDELPCRPGQEPAAEASWFTSGLETRERDQAIQHCLRRLPPEQQDVLTLKIWGGQTLARIAATLGISPNTAASRYRYALEAMRKHLPADV